jgi:flagellar biosynthesis anti-sigma factor FlgM
MKMRINSEYGPQPVPESGQNNPQTGAANGSSSSGIAGEEDETQLSGAQMQVDALATQASQLPDVRLERVQSLRQAVFGGQYQLDPQKVAGALLAHMTFSPALG